jgi:hypothetical protein
MPAKIIARIIALLATANAALAQTPLPVCIDSPDVIAEIQRIQASNRKSARKYDGYRKALSASPDAELATRLAYAETLAANCPDHNVQVSDLVAAVIGNRIRIRHGDVKSVVYQRDQFSSSLNIYPESRYRDFLCPRDVELWNLIAGKVLGNLQEAGPGKPIPQDAVNYYLYRHSPRFNPPAWELEEIVLEKGAVRDCVRVFRDSGWK